MSWEIHLLDMIQIHLQSNWGDQWMPFISLLGNSGLFWVALSAILLFFPNTRRAGATMLVALLFSFLFCNLTLKPLFDRIRPFVVNPDAVLLIAPPLDASFPSGHSAASFAAAAALFLQHKRSGVLALLLAAAIAFSRLYLYVHFPTDVIIGSLLGILCGYAAQSAMKWWINKYSEK